MRITIYGATGHVGSRVTTEAVARGHHVTAVTRNPASLNESTGDVTVRTGEATNADQIAELSVGQDVVISATRPPPGREHELVTVADALLDGVGRSGSRLILVGGAGTLIEPGTGGQSVIDNPALVPPPARPIALACIDQLEACRKRPDVNWTYLAPPADLQPGTRTGHYRTGTTSLVVDETGRSAISTEDFAVAVLDEAEHPQHPSTRFTVAH